MYFKYTFLLDRVNTPLLAAVVLTVEF